jgi:alpha-amylase/alpha-mannosidase (GH57 family)
MAAKLAFLWHMHQPCYYDPAAQRYRMPWVFLHAAKDYYEMLALALEGRARVTFNMVPSLLDQLADYADPAVADAFLVPLRKDPAELNGPEKEALAAQLAMANLENQIRRYPRYFALHKKLAEGNGQNAAAKLKRAEWLDLEVLYLISWTGEITRDESPLVKALAEKGSGYSQEDKLALLGFLHELCARTPVALGAAEEAGRIEISATPYYHPILPLLIDPLSAREAVENIRIPVLERGFGDDAAWHVEHAIARHAEIFGRKPRGFWPSEGSVSTRAVALLAGRGVKWAASDEDVLAASLGHPLTGAARKDLYRPYAFTDEADNTIHLFFRDKGLSDLIGFTYASWEPEAAAKDFVGRLHNIVRACGPDVVIPVILDGENAWENYRENGAPFLRALYREVNASGFVEFETFSNLCGDAPRLTRIHAGSWIYGSFTTWMGHPEKNRAWELLERTRTRFTAVADGLTPEACARAWERLHAAEGSDWFWWLGDDHYTPLAGEFDELFRLQLAEVHKLIGEEPPAELRTPIKKVGRRGLLRDPRDRIRPTLDGRESSFFEWRDAGVFDLGYDAGSMHRTDRLLSQLKFGTDGHKLHLCLEGTKSLAGLTQLGYTLEIIEGASGGACAQIPPPPGKEIAAAWGEVVEISIPLKLLSPDASGRVAIAFRLLRDGALVERAPLFHMAEIPLGLVPTPGAWSV